MSKGLDKLAEGTGKVIETVPEVYDDALKPSMQETGKTLSLIPRTINAALVPLRQWIAEREYKLSETEKLLAEKLKNVAPEKIVTPDAYVAVPALQAISYSMNSEELRNLYATLLAKSMNVDVKDNVHPSFVEIIKQLSPNDARIFKIFIDSQATPLIDLSVLLQEGGQNYYRYNISWINAYSYETICVSIDNLIRLGLIEIPFDLHYSNNQIYNAVRKTSTYMEIHKELKALNSGEIKENLKYIKITNLGKLFSEICIY